MMRCQRRAAYAMLRIHARAACVDDDDAITRYAYAPPVCHVFFTIFFFRHFTRRTVKATSYAQPFRFDDSAPPRPAALC